MLYYLVLAVSTTIILFLCLKIWKKTREIGFVLGIGLIYYWSLLGAWFIIYDSQTDYNGINFGLHYYYFFQQLFYVSVDKYYMESIVLYSLFIIVIELVILFFTKPKNVLETSSNSYTAIELNHYVLIGLCFIAMMISFVLVWRDILTAAKFNLSVYTVTRGNAGRFFTIHQLLNQTMVVALYIGFITYISKEKATYLKGNSEKRILVLYLLAVFIIESYLLFLGNKREVLFGGIIGILIYFDNVNYKINKLWLGCFIVTILIPLFFCDGLRSYSPTFLMKYASSSQQIEHHRTATTLEKIFDTTKLEYKPAAEIKYTKFSIKNDMFVFLFSDEMFFAHFSMYGVLSHHIPLTYGTSFTSLGASLVPHFLWPNRPAGIYEYYVDKVNGSHGTGFTLHNATGWYLNFGIPGVFAGAFILGFLWTIMYNQFQVIYQKRKMFARIFFTIGFAAFTAQIPALIRNGPEGYKAVLFEALLLPAITIFIAAKFMPKKQK